MTSTRFDDDAVGRLIAGAPAASAWTDRCVLFGPDDLGPFMRHAQTVAGHVRRESSEGFEERYREATRFWTQLSVRERAHLVRCARVELDKLKGQETWMRAMAQFRRVDPDLARRVGRGLQHRGAERASVVELVTRRPSPRA